MKALSRISLCALALSFAPSFALADEPSLVEWTKGRVREVILKPLSHVEKRTFSRRAQPPQERRVRVTQTTTTSDKNGNGFVPFAIDVRYGEDWEKDHILGCAYRKTGEVLVKVGDGYRPAVFLLGKDVEPVAGACQAAPARS